MIAQHTGKMTAAGFNANTVELDAIKRCAAKNRESQASWCRRTLMKAAAEELGVPYATLDRYSPAYGSGPRAVASGPNPDRLVATERLDAIRAEAARHQAAADAKRTAAAKLEEVLAELAAAEQGESAPKPRRRR